MTRSDGKRFVIDDFRGFLANNWQLDQPVAPDKERPDRFNRFEKDFSASTDGAALRWEFCLPEAKGGATIRSYTFLNRAFTHLLLRLRNAGSHAVRVSASAAELGRFRYSGPSRDVPAGGSWHDLEFAISEFTSASAGQRPLKFPWREIAVSVIPLDPVSPSVVCFGELSGVTIPSSRARLRHLRMPAHARAGETITVTARLGLMETLRPEETVSLLIRRAEDGQLVAVDRRAVRDVWDEAGAEIRFADVRVPMYVRGGEHTLELWLAEGPIVSEEGPDPALRIVQREPGRTRFTVRETRGAPSVLVDSKPFTGMAYVTYHPDRAHYKNFHRAGFRVFGFPTTSDYHLYNCAPPCWLGEGQFDYGILDYMAAMALEVAPDGYLFPRVFVCSPPWWDEQHPGELAVGQGPSGERRLMLSHHYDGRLQKRMPSYSSELWRQDAAKAFRRYMEQIRSSPYRDRIMGFTLASGGTEEWFYWVNEGDHEEWPDYSRPHHEAFRAWLREKYEGNARLLRGAWGNQSADFATAVIPSYRERNETRMGHFRDPEAQGNVIDFYLFQSELVASTIHLFAKIIKEVSDGDYIVGAFYGYVLHPLGRHRYQHSGHYAIRRLLEDPCIDFLCSPTSYYDRRLGEGYSSFMSVTESVKLHGKTWYTENDIRTFVMKPVPDKSNEDICVRGWGYTRTREETIASQRREFANVITRGVCEWWFDINKPGYYDDELLMEAIGQMRAVGDASLEFDRSSIADVCVLVDEKACLYQAVNERLADRQKFQQLLFLGHSGFPYDVYLWSDLGKLRPYKMYVLLDTPIVTTAQQALLEERVKSRESLVLSVFAPGFLDGSRVSLENMEKTIGIRLGMSQVPRRYMVRIERCERPEFKGLEGSKYGLPEPLAPAFFVQDESSEVIGRYEDGGDPALVIRRPGIWTSVYSAAPALPPRLLRAICGLGDVHVFMDSDDTFYANASFLAVHTKSAGEKTVRLPRRTDVYDVFAEREVARGVAEFRLNAPARETFLFFLGDPRHWKLAYERAKRREDK